VQHGKGAVVSTMPELAVGEERSLYQLAWWKILFRIKKHGRRSQYGSLRVPRCSGMVGIDPQNRQSQVQALSRIFSFPDMSSWVVGSMSAMGTRLIGLLYGSW
jgi:hypothetical protein